ncbi:hypothetical protein ABPG73_013121 [Tetrahymena malaccensis]
MYQIQYTQSGIVDSDDEEHYQHQEKKEDNFVVENVVVEDTQQSDRSQNIAQQSVSQKKSSTTLDSNIFNGLIKNILNKSLKKSMLSEIQQLFYHDMIEDFDKGLEQFLKKKEQLEPDNLFYSIISYIQVFLYDSGLEECDKQEKKEKINEFCKKLNKYLNLIQQNLNQDCVKIGNVSKQLINYLIAELNVFKSYHLQLVIFNWINQFQTVQDLRLNYIIARSLIGLNQLDQAQFYVEQALMLLEKDSKMRDLFVILLFQCHSEQEIIEKEFNNRKKKYVNNDLEYLQFCFEYLKSLKRIGNVELVRKNLYLLGSSSVREYHKNFYEDNLLELFDLVIYTNRLPYVFKLMEYGKNFKSSQFIDIQNFENDPRDLLIELIACLRKKINEPFQTPYTIIYFSLFVGQDYESLQEQVKKNFTADIINKIEKKEKKANKLIYQFIEKEYQLIKPFLLKYFKNIEALIEEELPKIGDRIPYQDKKDRQNYIRLLMTLKNCGEYQKVVKLIDYGPIYEEMDYYLELFLNLSSQAEQQQMNFQIQEIIPEFLKSLSMNKQILSHIKFEFKHRFNRVLKNLQIFYNRAMCLTYLKKYQESYDTLLIIIAVIINLEGCYSFNLLPSLSLLSEVSSYLQQKSLSHQCLKYKQIILNDISYSDEDVFKVDC